jgi:tetratricopeptide (TPR) repeat protein
MNHPALEADTQGPSNKQNGVDWIQYRNELNFSVSLRPLKRENRSSDLPHDVTLPKTASLIPTTTTLDDSGRSSHLNNSLTTVSNSILLPEQERQRQVAYDEGMYLYSFVGIDDPLWLTTTNTMNTAEGDESSFYYMDLGHSHIANGDFGSALACWEVIFDELSVNSYPWLYHRTCYSMGYCWYRLGDLKKAAAFYQQSLQDPESLSPIHGAAVNNAMAILRLLDPTISVTSYDDEIEEDIPTILQNCYNAYVKQFGAYSKEAATIQNNLARSLFMAGKFEEALQSFEPCLQIRSSLLGFPSMDVAVTICNIGQTYHRLGQLDQALEHYSMFVHLCQKNCSTNHRDVTTIATYMADIYYCRGDWFNAKCYYEQSLEIHATVWGGNALDHWDDICPILIKLCDVMKQQKAYDTVLNLYAKLYHIQSHVHGSVSHQVIVTLSSIGLIYYEQGDYQMAFQNYNEVLQKQLILHSFADHSDISSTLNSIGLILLHQEGYQHAMSCFCESLRMKLSLLGPHHHEIAVVWYNIASVYHGQGDHDNAIAYYKEAVRIEYERQRWEQDNSTPSDTSDMHSPSSNIVRSLQKLGAIHQENGDFEEALKYYKQALDLELKKVAGARDDSSIGMLLNIIGNIHFQCANIGTMMQCLIQASRIFRQLNDHDRESITISGYGFYYLSRMCPSSAAAA